MQIAAILSALLAIIGKAVSIGAKVVLNRATFIIILIGTISATIVKIFSAFDDASSGINKMFQVLNTAQFEFGSFVAENEVFQLLSYCLSLDVLYDVIFTWLFWFFISLLSIIISLVFYLSIQIIPMLAEIFTTAIKNQYAKMITGSI